MADSSGDLRRSLRVLRAERDLTQKALAEAADLSPAYVSQIESGQKRPSMDTLERLAGALGVPVSELLSGSGGDAAAAPAQSWPPPVSGSAEMPTPMPARSRDGHRGRARQLAEELLRDPARAADLAVAARSKLEASESWRLGEVRTDLRTLIDLLAAYASGTYRAVPWEALVLVAAGLQYYVDPEDVVPDYLDAGYLDDAAVLVFVTEMVAPELDRFTAGR